MSKIKDLTGVVRDLAANGLTLAKRLTTVHSDLYASIKEVGQLKYRIVELELRLSNLEETVKSLMEKGG